MVNPNSREDVMPNAEKRHLLEERKKKLEEEIRKEQAAAKGCGVDNNLPRDTYRVFDHLYSSCFNQQTKQFAFTFV